MHVKNTLFQFQLGTIGTRQRLIVPVKLNISIPVRYDWNLWAQMWIVFVYHLVAVAKIRQESGKKCRCRKIDFGRGYDNCISEGYNVIKELKF